MVVRTKKALIRERPHCLCSARLYRLHAAAYHHHDRRHNEIDSLAVMPQPLKIVGIPL